MDKKNVLIFPGGTEIGLEIWRSLKDSKDISLFSAGSNVSNHGPFVFKKHFIIPDVHENNWIEKLAEICQTNHIDYIFPAHDDVIVALAENSEKIKAKIVSSPLKTCLISRSKSKTYEQLNGVLPVPRLFKQLSEVESFPVFVKPDKGQGSLDAEKVNDAKSLKALIDNNPNLIILEYLSGREYTVDCFTDREKGLLFCQGRERIRTKSGISMSSKPVDKQTNEVFVNYAEKISQKIEFHGAWFFQVKISETGEYKLLEIAPRISGTMATSRVLGVNFAALSIYEVERVNVVIMTNNAEVQIDRALTNRYLHNIKYEKVYVDLDDTLIISNKVNCELVKFLYESINKGCKIILITKNVLGDNVGPFLKQFRLDSLFDKVICLKKTQSKADFIEEAGSIFIDDSFSERKSVYEKIGIPTFDCSMLELLFDDRV